MPAAVSRPEKRLGSFNQVRGEIEEAALEPERIYGGTELALTADPETAMRDTTVERYLELASGGELPKDQVLRDTIRIQVAHDESGGAGADGNAAFHDELVKRATKRRDHAALYGEVIRHARAGVFLDFTERGEGNENPFTWQSFLTRARVHPGYTPGYDDALYQSWLAARQDMENRAGRFAPDFKIIWRQLSKAGRRQSLDSLLDPHGVAQLMLEKAPPGEDERGDPNAAPTNAQDAFIMLLQDAKRFGSATAAMSGAADKRIWKERNGRWNFPELQEASDNWVTEGFRKLWNVGSQKAGARMVVDGPMAGQLKMFQEKWKLSDQAMVILWSDLGNIHRKWEPEEKSRVLSNGILLPNPINSDWLDTERALAMIGSSGASRQSKSYVLRHISRIQTELRDAKLAGYEAASAAVNYSSVDIPRFPSPSDWAKEQGRDIHNDPDLILDYENAVIKGSPVLLRYAWGFTADQLQGFNKVFTSAAGALGLAGWEDAGDAGARGVEASSMIESGQPDTGFAGKVIEELPSIAFQIAVTRGIGMGIAAATTAATAATATAGTAVGTAVSAAGRTAGFLSAPMVAGVQAGGSTYSSELAGGASHEDARSKAMRSAIATTVITAAFSAIPGAGGVESVAAGRNASEVTVRQLLSSISREELKKNLGKFARETFKSAAGESVEEWLNTLLETFVNADPDTNLADAWSNALEAAALGGFLGGASHLASSAFEGHGDTAAIASRLSQLEEMSAADESEQADAGSSEEQVPEEQTIDQPETDLSPPPLPGDLPSDAPPVPVFAPDPRISAAIEVESHDRLYREARVAGISVTAAVRIADEAAPHIAAARTLADIFKGFAKKLPDFGKVLATLPDTVKDAFLSGSEARSADPVRDAIAYALAGDLPQVNWGDGDRGVLDGAWARDPALLPHLLPVVLNAVAPHLPAAERVNAFRNSTDTELLALGIPADGLPVLRSSYERSTLAASAAIKEALANLDPDSEIARAATAELQFSLSARASATPDGASITVLPDGTFRIGDAEGEEIGMVKDAAGVRELAKIVRASPKFASEKMNFPEAQTAPVKIDLFKKTKSTAHEFAKGGAYSKVKGVKGNEAHHIPPDSVSPLKRNDGPAISMRKAHHRKTKSWGSSKKARAYRKVQKDLIEKGRFTEAQQMDIDEIREKFGTQYDTQLQELLDYTSTLIIPSPANEIRNIEP